MLQHAIERLEATRDVGTGNQNIENYEALPRCEGTASLGLSGTAHLRTRLGPIASVQTFASQKQPRCGVNRLPATDA